MKPVLVFLALCLSFLPPAVKASTWHPLRSDPLTTLEAGEAVPVVSAKKGEDKGKDDKKEKALRIWARVIHSLPQQARPGDFFYNSAKFLLEVNCTTRTTRPQEKIYYDQEGSEVKRIRFNERESPETVVPESPEEQVLDFACRGKPVTATKPPAPGAAKAKPPAKPAVAAKQGAISGPAQPGDAKTGRKTVPAPNAASQGKPTANPPH